MNKKLVVSNYNWDINWLKITNDYGFNPENTIIYDKSDGIEVVYDFKSSTENVVTYVQNDEKKDWSHIGKVFKSCNFGANQYDVLKFIIENYYDLPDITVFIKGNLLFTKKDEENYYVTLDRFLESLQTNMLFSVWYDKWLLKGDYRHVGLTPLETLKNGRLIQPISDTYDSRIEHRYFSNINDILNWLFVEPPKLTTIEFIPASNFVVPKENILKYSKNFYEKLQSIISYHPSFHTSWAKNVSGETYLLERIFYFIWNENLKEKNVIQNVVQ